MGSLPAQSPQSPDRPGWSQSAVTAAPPRPAREAAEGLPLLMCPPGVHIGKLRLGEIVELDPSYLTPPLAESLKEACAK